MFDTQKPKLIQESFPGYLIRFDLTEEIKNEEAGWSYKETAAPNLEYGTVVAAIIHHRYPIDAEIALLNNYIVDPEARASEWQEYQDWRAFAKTYTRETLGIEK